MKIVREQREENTSLVKVTVGEEDYGQSVEKALREYRRKANIPGFRPGMVPMGIIKKMYGKGVLAEQSYRTASNAVFEYLQKENIDYLGDVIPSEEQGAFDFENGKEFEFVFEIGEAPEIKLDLSKQDKLTYNAIAVDKKMHDDYRSNFLRRFGRLVDAEEVTSDEALSVTLDNGEMNVADAYVGLISMSEEERKPFLGKKVGYKTEVNINELYKNPSQRAAVLQVKENELEGIKPEFSLEITQHPPASPSRSSTRSSSRWPSRTATSRPTEEFEKPTSTRRSQSELRRESDYLFTLQLRDYLIEKAGLKMPEAFLKRWLYTINEGKFSMEEIEKDFDAVPEDVHLELHPEALHQAGQPLGQQGGGRGRGQGAGCRAVRTVRHAVGSRRHARRLRRKDPRRQGAGPEDLREALRNEGCRGREVENHGRGEVRFGRRVRQIGTGAPIIAEK